jgi:adenylate cyclase
MTRRLWLLGPACVDQAQKPQGRAAGTEAEGSIAGEIPRFRSRHTLGLLGYLAAERRPVARDLLTALLWPDWAPSRGRANLRRNLHNLAQILPNCWELDRQSVAFIPSAGTTVDIYALLALEAEERWDEAAELLRGEFLEGLYLHDNPEFDNWLLGERERWRRRAEVVLRHIIEGHTRRGRYSDALRETQRLLQRTPWNEEAQRHAMRLLAWTGQRGAALRQFEVCKRVLSEELDVQPASETIALYRQIHAGQLDLPPQLPAFLSDEGSRREFERPLFVGREGQLTQLDGFLAAALAGQGQVIFVTGGPGRGKTALLNAFSSRAMEMHPNLLVASGKCNAYSGIGDPYLPFRDVMGMLTGDVEGRWDAGAITRDHARRLWAAFTHVVQALLDHGLHLLDVLVPSAALLSRSVAAGQDYAPWLPRLREAVKRDWTSAEELEQSHLFQQVTNVLRIVAQEKPLLLILDDIQWADAASISLLFHLGRRLVDADCRLLIACAYRPEEVATGRFGERHPLAKPLGEFKRTFGDVWVDLGRGARAADRSFVDALLDSTPNRLAEGFRDALFHRTGGHPLFTVELLRAMQERGNLLRDEDGRWIEGRTLDWELLPARVEAVIKERFDRLAPELQDVLTIASVEGELFTAQVVAKVRNVPERSLLRQLSRDLERRHRLVREQEEFETDQRRMSRFQFGHILYQDYVYRRLGRGERRLLHGDVAAALEELFKGQLDQIAVQLAHHFHKAGDHRQAFRYSTLAAERAARVYENGEAITYYTRAIQLADKVAPDVISLARIYSGRGQAFESLGEFDRAHADHTAAQQMAHAAGGHEVEQVEWRALLDLGRLWASRDHNQARGYFETALELARRLDDPAFLAGSLNWMGNWHTNDENFKQAVAYHREALSVVEDLENPRELANTLDLLGIANLLGGDLNSSLQYYDRSIALCRELDERQRLASSLMGRATTVSMLVLLASVSVTLSSDPTFDIDEALRIARQIDSVSEDVWAHWALGLLCMLRGEYGRALKELQSGLHIASTIGHREWVVGTRFGLGILYVELFAPDRARRQLEAALALAREMRSPMWAHLVSGALAGTYLQLGDQTSAQTCLEKVIDPQTPMDTLGKRYCWVRQAELALAQGDSASALEITERLIASAPGMSPGRVITFLWKLKGQALAAMDYTENACSLLQAALENAHATGERFLLWRIHASLGRLYCAMERQEASETEFSIAGDLIEELAATLPDEGLKSEFVQGARSALGLC